METVDQIKRSYCSHMDAMFTVILVFSTTTQNSTQSKKRSQMALVWPLSRTLREEESKAGCRPITLQYQTRAVQHLHSYLSKTTSCRTFWVKMASWVVASIPTTSTHSKDLKVTEIQQKVKFAIFREQFHPLSMLTPSSRPHITISNLNSTTGTQASPATTTLATVASTE